MKKWLRFLSIFLIVIGLFILVWPFYPTIQYYLFPPSLSAKAEEIIRLPPVELPSSPQVIPSATPSITASPPPSQTPSAPEIPIPSSSQAIPTEALIVIPKIGLEARIVPDLEPQSLMEGVGHDPSTEQPGTSGVCILYGHRFLNYTDPSSGYFYLLDKLSMGDLVVVYWEGKSYHYVVQESMIINPDDFSIYNKREKPTLVLVTCTPLWSDQFRLVVIAEPSTG